MRLHFSAAAANHGAWPVIGQRDFVSLALSGGSIGGTARLDDPVGTVSRPGGQ